MITGRSAPWKVACKDAMRLANLTVYVCMYVCCMYIRTPCVSPISRHKFSKVLYIVTVFNIHTRALTFEKFRQDVAGQYCEIRSHCQGGKRTKAINALSQLEKKLGLEISHTCSGPSRHLSGRSWQK
jgi:hypothetical protein